MVDKRVPIGLFDSGVGGLTVLHSLQKVLPNEDFLYLGDTARLPYGTKSQETVIHYALQACRVLMEREIKCLVVACNTASALALPTLLAELNTIPIIGVLEPGAQAAVHASQTGKIALIATDSTVQAAGYQKRIAELRPNAEVRAQSCPLLVALAEEGWVEGPIPEAICTQYFAPLLDNFTPDTLLLGCTHFPALRSPIRSVVGDGIQIIDSAASTAEFVKQTLAKQNILNLSDPHRRNPVHFLVTDSPDRFRTVAKRFLNDDITASQVEWVNGYFV